MEEFRSSSSPKRIALVTGGNKGIGLEICRQLACNAVKVILTARDEKRGLEAVEKLKAKGVSDMVFHQLDVSDAESIASLADFIMTRIGKLDILVNNAGIGGLTLDFKSVGSSTNNGDENFSSLIKRMRETYEDAEECNNINFLGVKRVTEALSPFLQLSSSPRIVIVSSRFGKLSHINNASIKQELNEVDTLSIERLDELLQQFLKDFKENKLEENGWPTTASAYKVSKVFVNAYTRILAKRYSNFIVNCVHPGSVKTDINWNTGTLSVEEGAKGPVKLALLPDGSRSGLFFDQTEASSY